MGSIFGEVAHLCATVSREAIKMSGTHHRQTSSKSIRPEDPPHPADQFEFEKSNMRLKGDVTIRDRLQRSGDAPDDGLHSSRYELPVRQRLASAVCLASLESAAACFELKGSVAGSRVKA